MQSLTLWFVFFLIWSDSVCNVNSSWQAGKLPAKHFFCPAKSGLKIMSPKWSLHPTIVSHLIGTQWQMCNSLHILSLAESVSYDVFTEGVLQVFALSQQCFIILQEMNGEDFERKAKVDVGEVDPESNNSFALYMVVSRQHSYQQNSPFISHTAVHSMCRCYSWVGCLDVSNRWEFLIVYHQLGPPL